jgi:sulfoxide reductase catalytic subunit YedY
LTKEEVAAEYNNFYEFGSKKTIAWLAQRLKIRPWQVKVEGLVHKPTTFDIDALIRAMPLEERLYRFRCVEAWAMAVPWTGFPLSALIQKVAPKSDAKYVKLTTFMDRSVALGQLQVWYPWPYVEALTMKEAVNDLTLLATGIYGHPLPKQHGAPLRLVVPWKYGFKNIKSIVSIAFTRERPKTFWETVGPSEYGFWANINPGVAHPRWSQAEERMLGTDEKRPTKLFNGYGDWVASLYPDLSNRRYFM